MLELVGFVPSCVFLDECFYKLHHYFNVFVLKKKIYANMLNMIYYN